MKGKARGSCTKRVVRGPPAEIPMALQSPKKQIGLEERTWNATNKRQCFKHSLMFSRISITESTDW